jgi:hypothetical protein
MMTSCPNLATNTFTRVQLSSSRTYCLCSRRQAHVGPRIPCSHPYNWELFEERRFLVSADAKVVEQVAARDSDDSAPVLISTVVERPQRVSSKTKERRTTISTARDATATVAAQRGLKPGAF